MGAIFRAQWLNLIHNPVAFLIMVGLSIITTLFMGGQTFDRVVVPLVPDTALSGEQVDRWVELLDDSDAFTFQVADEAAVLEDLAGSSSGLAVRLSDSDWQVLRAAGETGAPALAAHVGAVFRREQALRQAGLDSPELRARVEERLATPALTVQAANESSEAAFEFDSSVHMLLGMGLFYGMFTIMFTVLNLLEDRRIGVWDRVIQSSTPRSAMYLGHLLFSTLAGVVQIVLVFGIFIVLFGVDLGHNLPGVFITVVLYTVAIVALGLVIAGLMGTAKRMQVIVPIVAVSSAMLGGAYWPIEIVSNPVLLALSRVVPIRYALDALKGIVYYDYGWAQLAGPWLVLAGFAALFMVVGLLLIDRRR